MKVTMSDVRGVYESAVRAAEAAGLSTDGWQLHEGNAYRAWALWRLELPSHGLSDPLGSGGTYLGETKAEAYRSLQMLARAWFAVAELKAQR